MIKVLEYVVYLLINKKFLCSFFLIRYPLIKYGYFAYIYTFVMGFSVAENYYMNQHFIKASSKKSANFQSNDTTTQIAKSVAEEHRATQVNLNISHIVTKKIFDCYEMSEKQVTSKTRPILYKSKFQ